MGSKRCTTEPQPGGLSSLSLHTHQPGFFRKQRAKQLWVTVLRRALELQLFPRESVRVLPSLRTELLRKLPAESNSNGSLGIGLIPEALRLFVLPVRGCHGNWYHSPQSCVTIGFQDCDRTVE